MTKRLPASFVLAALLLSFAPGIPFAQDKAPPPITRIYNVRDLTTPLPEFSGLEFAGPLAPPQGEKAGRGIQFEDVPEGANFEPKCADELLCDLIDLIKQVIEAGTWDEGGGCAIRGRAGIIIATHTAETHAKIQQLLDDLRKSDGKTVVVRVRFVAPKRADVERIGAEKRSLAVTEAEKAELLKLAGEPLCEARIVEMEGQKLPLTAAETVQRVAGAGEEARVDTIVGGITGWARSLILHDGSLRLDLSVTMCRSFGKGAPGTAPPQVELRVKGSYRLPDGGVLFASGASVNAEDGNKEVYALIDVQVIGAPKAK